MSKYVEQNVGKDEGLILEAKVHWTTLVPPIIILIIGLIGLSGGTASGSSDAAPAFMVFFFFAIIIAIPRIIRMFTTELAFTNKKVLGKVGLINTKALDAPLNKINNVSVSSGLGGKIFGYANILITTSSGSFPYKGIAGANNFKTSLMEQIDQYDEDRIKKQAEEMARAIKS